MTLIWVPEPLEPVLSGEQETEWRGNDRRMPLARLGGMCAGSAPHPTLPPPNPPSQSGLPKPGTLFLLELPASSLVKAPSSPLVCHQHLAWHPVDLQHLVGAQAILNGPCTPEQKAPTVLEKSPEGWGDKRLELCFDFTGLVGLDTPFSFGTLVFLSETWTWFDLIICGCRAKERLF